MGYIDECLEKRSGDSRVKQVVRISLVEATRWMCGNSGVGSCLQTVVAWWYLFAVSAQKSVANGLTVEAELGVWVARVETGLPGSYLHPRPTSVVYCVRRVYG